MFLANTFGVAIQAVPIPRVVPNPGLGLANAFGVVTLAKLGLVGTAGML